MNFVSHKNFKIVNIDNVTNVGYLREKLKIVFNMNYGITLQEKLGSKIISDYVYWEFTSVSEYESCVDMINKKTSNWIRTSKEQRIVNPKLISSIVFDDTNFKIIFNFSHTVTLSTGGLTSEFTFHKFSTQEKYNFYKEQLKNNLQ